MTADGAAGGADVAAQAAVEAAVEAAAAAPRPRAVAAPGVQVAGPTETRRVPISEITRIVRKRSGGEALTPEEKEVLRVYYRKYSRSKQALHLKGGRRIEWLELADRQGLSFSSWAQERIVEAMSGPGPIVDELRTENQRLRDEVASLRGTTGQLSVENSRMHARLEAMEPVLVEAAQLAKQLAGRQ